MAQQLQNQFKQSSVKGQTDLKMSPSVMTCQVDAGQATPLVPGQLVTVVDSIGGIPKVIASAADTSDHFGVVLFNFKDKSYPAGQAVEIAFFKGTVVFMEAGGAIARNGKVMGLIAGQKVLAAVGSGKVVVGRALDKALADGDLIRVIVNLPGEVLP